MNPLTIRWKIVPLKKPWRASFLKLSMVFGAASVQNCTTIWPSLVFITATSLDEFMGLFSSFFSPAARTAELNITTERIRNFIQAENAFVIRISLFIMIFLQTAHLDFSLLQRANAVRAG